MMMISSLRKNPKTRVVPSLAGRPSTPLTRGANQPSITALTCRRPSQDMAALPSSKQGNDGGGEVLQLAAAGRQGVAQRRDLQVGNLHDQAAGLGQEQRKGLAGGGDHQQHEKVDDQGPQRPGQGGGQGKDDGVARRAGDERQQQGAQDPVALVFQDARGVQGRGGAAEAEDEGGHRLAVQADAVQQAVEQEGDARQVAGSLRTANSEK